MQSGDMIDTMRRGESHEVMPNYDPGKNMTYLGGGATSNIEDLEDIY